MITNIDKYRVDTNYTKYHIISKLIFRRIIITKFMMRRQLFRVKNVCNNVKNQHVQNGRKDFFELNYRVVILPYFYPTV